MDLYDLFQAIKERPGAFLGTPSISNLHVFLQGYYFARTEFNKPQTAQELEFAGFQDWVQHKYKIKSCHSWANIILLNSADERSAFWLFFDLFEEYLEQVRLLVSKSSNLKNQSKRVPGLHQGKIWISEDFNDPLPDSFWLGE